MESFEERKAWLAIAERAVFLGRQRFFELDRKAVRSEKGDRDFATHIDFEIEDSIAEFLRGETPDIGLLAEEEHPLEHALEFAWVLDPIDGTVNFWHAHPFCAISLALVTKHEPLVAVVALPYLDLVYSAIKGGGSKRNGQPIGVSSVSELSKSVTGFGDFAVSGDVVEKNKSRLSVINALAGQVLRVRMHGSAATDLCFVADGKLDASIALSNSTWDMQGGVLIAREAGAQVTDARGRFHTIRAEETICSNGKNGGELLTLIQEALATRA